MMIPSFLPGESAYFKMKRMMVTKLDEPYGVCAENRTLNTHLGEGYEYDEAGCLNECVDREIEQKCGCTERLLKVSTRVCLM